MTYNILLTRLYDNGGDTLGILYYLDLQGTLRYCWTIEDEFREIKQYGETRIPAGRYKVVLRKEGGFYERYCNHKNKQIRDLTNLYGMLQIKDVPQYEYVLFHIGNDESDTAGCVLVGNKAINNSKQNGWVDDSTGAYIDFVRCVYNAMSHNQVVYLNILDSDREIQKQFGVL
jgi:hypothetical protein